MFSHIPGTHPKLSSLMFKMKLNAMHFIVLLFLKLSDSSLYTIRKNDRGHGVSM